MKEILKKGFIGFAMSAFIGTAVNMIVDIIANALGVENFISMSPDFRNLFPTPVIAAYVNVFMYGIIGATFSVMTFIYEVNKLGVVLQNIIYFLVTAPVAVGIAVLIWQLHHYPKAIISTLVGYGLCYLIIGILQYRKLKDDIRQINEELE